MANNRLYVKYTDPDDADERYYLMISKGFGRGWCGLRNEELLERLILRDVAASQSGDTNLSMFTEDSKEYEDIMSTHKNYNPE